MLAMAGMMVLRRFLSPCGPFRELQPASLLTMRESITITHFPGHYQRWGEPRARMNAGVMSRALCRAIISPAMRRDAAVSKSPMSGHGPSSGRYRCAPRRLLTRVGGHTIMVGVQQRGQPCPCDRQCLGVGIKAEKPP